MITVLIKAIRLRALILKNGLYYPTVFSFREFLIIIIAMVLRNVDTRSSALPTTQSIRFFFK